tara:strand:+ start:167 stop:367 length:201 start_codon:yes stop_codon:yes gene_type:complete
MRASSRVGTERADRYPMSQAGEPLNVANIRKYNSGIMKDRMWIIETNKVSVPFLYLCLVRKTRYIE